MSVSPCRAEGRVFLPSRFFLSLALLMGLSSPATARTDFGEVYDGVQRGLNEGMLGQPDARLERLLEGAALFASDGTFLGYWTDRFAPDSIFNENGPYGSKASNRSVKGEFGPYGSPDGERSAWNPFSHRPPYFSRKGRFICYLTTNTTLEPRLDPRVLFVRSR